MMRRMTGWLALVVVLGLVGRAFAMVGVATETDLQGGIIGIVNPLAVAVGGTGNATLTDRAVLLGRGTAAVDFASPGNAGQVLRSTGAAANPAFGALDLADTDAITNTLPVANGGTNLTSAADDNVMVGNGTTWQSKALTDCDGANQAVTYDTTTNAFGCVTISSGSPYFVFSTLFDTCVTATANCTATGNTVYIGATPDATEGRAQIIAPNNISIDDLRCVSSVAPGTGEDFTVTMRDGACTGALSASANQTCVISGTNRSCAAATTQEDVTGGECYSFQVVGSDGAANGVVTCSARQGA